LKKMDTIPSSTFHQKAPLSVGSVSATAGLSAFMRRVSFFSRRE